MLVSLFNNVAVSDLGLQAWDFIKKRLQHCCLPVSCAKVLEHVF